MSGFPTPKSGKIFIKTCVCKGVVFEIKLKVTRTLNIKYLRISICGDTQNP